MRFFFSFLRQLSSASLLQFKEGMGNKSEKLQLYRREQQNLFGGEKKKVRRAWNVQSG